VTCLTKPVRRLSQSRLDGSFGPDREKRIVITLHPDGRLELRPECSRRPETLHLLDAYRYAVRCRVNYAILERARKKKDAKATRLARLRQERAEKRLFENGEKP